MRAVWTPFRHAKITSAHAIASFTLQQAKLSALLQAAKASFSADVDEVREQVKTLCSALKVRSSLLAVMLGGTAWICMNQPGALAGPCWRGCRF